MRGGRDAIASWSRRRRVTLVVVADDCVPRRMILNDSTWRPEGEAAPIPERRDRAHRRRTRAALAEAGGGEGQLAVVPRSATPSGVADGQNLPDTWDVKTGENILWRTPIPGLAHSSPIVWGDRDLRHDRDQQQGERDVQARTLRRRRCVGRSLAAQVDALRDRQARRARSRGSASAFEGAPRNKRHIKSTYASATPATDGRIVVAWFGSQGVHAYDVNGKPLWKVDLGRVDIGAYDIPSFEWGPASSPIIWNGPGHRAGATRRPTRSCSRWTRDRQDGVEDGSRRSCRRGARRPSSSTPAGDELVTNASNFVRGYDPRTGKELWRLGGSSKITAPTPFAAGRPHRRSRAAARPERPIFVVRPGARGDLTPGRRTDERAPAVAWSKTGRGSVHADAARLRRPALRARQQRRVRRVRPADRRGGLPPAARAGRQRLQRVAGGRRRQASISRAKTATSSSSPPDASSSSSRRTRWASC